MNATEKETDFEGIEVLAKNSKYETLQSKNKEQKNLMQ